jgi:spore coat polysaccharide biosynthesis protein SpsF
MKIIGIIIARLDSSRLPGKALRVIDDRPLIAFAIERAKRISKIDSVVIATSAREVDKPLVRVAQSYGIDYYQGDLKDVAGRVLGCASANNSDYFVRLNADSPFIDYNLIDKGISICLKAGADFCSNIIQRTFPYGIAVEIVKTPVYKKCYLNMVSGEDKEHVTRYLYRNLDLLDYREIHLNNDRYSNARLVVDTKEDFELFKRMVDALGVKVLDAGYDEVGDLYFSLTGNNTKIYQGKKNDYAIQY